MDQHLRQRHEPRILVVAGNVSVALSDLTEASHTENMLGVDVVNVSLPISYHGASMLVPEAILEVKGAWYYVRRIERHRANGVPMMSVMAEAGHYVLGDGVNPARELTTADAPLDVARDAVGGTGWWVTAMAATPAEWSLSEGSPLAQLREMAETFDLDLKFDSQNRTLELVNREQLGTAGFVWGADVTESRKTVDSTKQYNVIYGQTFDGKTTITSVNGGSPAVQDVRPGEPRKELTLRFPNGSDPVAMRDRCLELLATNARAHVSYELNLADRSAWTGQSADRFKLGDLVDVVDEELGIRTTEQIVEIEWDLLRPWQTRVRLAGSPEALSASLGDVDAIANAASAIDSLSNAFDGIKADFGEFGSKLADLETRVPGPGAPTSDDLQEILERLTQLEQNVVVVNRHGTNGSAARLPIGAAIYWIGPATPTNNRDGDIWRNPA